MSCPYKGRVHRVSLAWPEREAITWTGMERG